MRRILEFMTLAAALGTPLCHGQSMQDMVSFKKVQVGGVRLYNVSTFGGYSTSAAQPGVVSGIGSNLLGPDFNYGASAAAGWQHHGKRTNIAFLYSGSYMRMARYTDLNSYNQAASLGIGWTLTPKWSVNLSGAAQDANLVQFMFQPSNLGVVSNLHASFDDLAAAFSIGRFSDAQMATMLTGSPILDTPTRNLLLGNRILSASLQATLTYSHSSRLSFRFGSFTAGAQRVKGVQTGVLPSSKGINGGVAMSYSLSARTELGVSADVSHIRNALQRSTVYSSTASWGRKMGPRWFLRMGGGGAYTQTNGYSSALQAIGDGAIGFRTPNHTFVAAATRSATDPFGIAAAETTVIGGSWSWRPAALWSVSSNFSHQRWARSVYNDLSGWQSATGVSRQLRAGLTLSAEYSYLFGTSLYLGTLGNQDIHGVRVSLSWSPESGGR